MKPDEPLCHCFHISRRKVTNFLRIHRPRVASQISECGGAGTGCGWCVPFLKRLHRDIVLGDNSDNEPDTTPSLDEIDTETYATKRAEYRKRQSEPGR